MTFIFSPFHPFKPPKTTYTEEECPVFDLHAVRMPVYTSVLANVSKILELLDLLLCSESGVERTPLDVGVGDGGAARLGLD